MNLDGQAGETVEREEERRTCDGTESFLTGSVPTRAKNGNTGDRNDKRATLPDLQFDLLSVDFDDACAKLDADCVRTVSHELADDRQ